MGFFRFVRALALLPCFMCAPGVLAGSAYSSAGLLPADATIAATFDDASSLIRDPVWKEIAGSLFGGLDQAEVGAAWSRLAKRLELDEVAAFDLLMGRRVVYVQRARGVEAGPGAPSWAMLSEVRAGTERLLVSKLDLAPRRIERGRQVLAVENGRFWLTAMPGKDRATLILGPAEAPELFNEIVAGWGGPPKARLAGQRALIDVARHEPMPRAWIWVRIAGQDGPAAIACSLTFAGPTLKCHLAIDSQSIDAAAANTPPWSRGPFDALAKNATAALMEHRVTTGTEAPWSMLSFMGKWLPPAFTNLGNPRLVGPRLLFLMNSTGDSETSLITALETTDTRALAPAADRLISAAITTTLAASGQQAVQNVITDMGGDFIEALRTVDVGSALGPAARVFMQGTKFKLSWCYRPMEGAASGETVPGWWVTGNDAGHVTRASVALASRTEDEGERARWLSLGVVRPGELVDKLGRVGIRLPDRAAALVPALKSIRKFRWSLFRTDQGTIAGDAELQLEAPETQDR